jgi:hypothetical protein
MIHFRFNGTRSSIMARLYSNTVILGSNGLIGGQVTDRTTRVEKSILNRRPLLDDYREANKARKAHEAAIRESTTYASFAQTQDIYITKAKRMGVTPYYVALADWFEAPKVLESNVDGWTGKIGQMIRVKARDNVKVAHVTLVIRDADENILEMGEATQSEPGSAWWNYTTKSLVQMTPFPIVEVTAYDLPGNSDTFVIS